MLMCDVLAEREEQQRLQRRKKNFQEEQERQWNEYEKQQLEEAELAEKKKLEAEYRKKMENANVIQDQLHEFKMDYVKRMQEDMLEGELLKRMVEDGIKADHEKQNKKREDLLKLQEEQ